MDLREAAILGFVQGLTEFLPVSSSAHLRIASVLLGTQDIGAANSAAIQLGTLLAVLVYFGKDILRVVTSLGRAGRAEDRSMFWAVAVGTVPIGVLGLAFEDQISHQFRNLTSIAVSLIVMGFVLLIAERLGSKSRGVEEVTWKDGLKVGLAQVLALVPGCSRSGSTIAGALAFGFKKEDAARFSFYLSIPSILFAGLYGLAKEGVSFQGQAGQAIAVANVVSFVVGIACIKALLWAMPRIGAWPFVAWRLIVGIGILVAILTGRLDPMAGAV